MLAGTLNYDPAEGKRGLFTLENHLQKKVSIETVALATTSNLLMPNYGLN